MHDTGTKYRQRDSEREWRYGWSENGVGSLHTESDRERRCDPSPASNPPYTPTMLHITYNMFVTWYETTALYFEVYAYSIIRYHSPDTYVAGTPSRARVHLSVQTVDVESLSPRLHTKSKQVEVRASRRARAPVH